MRKEVICFTGGGTGGHVYPAKAIIEKIQEENPQWQIHWIGSSKGMEKAIVEKWGIPYKGISSGKLRRYFSFHNFMDVFRIIFGFFQARSYLKKIGASVLFSKGGFVSVPPVWAARSLGIPIYSHDSDMDPGLATRLNARHSRKIFIPYESSMVYYQRWKEKILVSGNPVRQDFYSAQEEIGKEFIGYSGNKPILLILGGSLGAQEINQAVQAQLHELCRHFFVVHQTGPKAQTLESRQDYRPFSYIHEALPHVLKAAHVAFSRAGAGSLWELAITNTSMLLLPLEVGSRGDQQRNARWFEEKGYAKILNRKDLTEGRLADTLKGLLPQEKEGKMIQKNLKNHPLPMGTDIIYKTIAEDLHL